MTCPSPHAVSTYCTSCLPLYKHDAWNSALDAVEEKLQTAAAIGSTDFLDGYQTALRRIHGKLEQLKM